MNYRLTWLFVRNWQASLVVLALWFVHAALRDGASVHSHFLGLSIDMQNVHSYPPWIGIFVVEAVLLVWYLLPSKAYSRHIRLLAAGAGVLLLVDLLFSYPIAVGLERAVAIYVFTSVLAYAVFWPSELAL